MSALDMDYSVYAYPTAATPVDITPAVTALEWGDLSSELAARAVITLAAVSVAGLDMADAAKFNTDIAVLVNGVVTFEGIIWDCTLTSGRELRLSCYDRLIYLTGSRDSAYFPAGNTTQSVISHICAKWDMPLTYTYMNCVHTRLSYRAISVADQITRTLDAAASMVGAAYMLRMESGRLHIGVRGEGGVKCEIVSASALSYTHRRTLSDLVTRVIVVTGDGDGPIKTSATLDGDTSLGILQQVVDGAGTSLKDARAQAEQLLRERGTPAETISLECLDVAALRRGDMVRVELGSISGAFDVLGVTHTDSRTMRLELSRHVEMN